MKATLRDKSLVELEEIFRELSFKLEELNKDAVMDRKYEFAMMPKDELSLILKGKDNAKAKRHVILTQIGYLRINLFAEFYERIQQAQKNGDLDKAVQLMRTYAETFAVPFISTRKESAFLKRLRGAFSAKRRLEPGEYINEWKTGYEAWFKQNGSAPPRMDDKVRMEEYDRLKKTFIMLYTISFSVDDFPPLRNRRSDHQA